MQPVQPPIGGAAADDDLYYSYHCLHNFFASSCRDLMNLKW